MDIPVSEAKTHLTDLVRRAEAGEDVVLTRHGKGTVQLVRVKPKVDRAARRRAIEEISKRAAAEATSGPCAARSQDFLYDDTGLPA